MTLGDIRAVIEGHSCEPPAGPEVQIVFKEVVFEGNLGESTKIGTERAYQVENLHLKVEIRVKGTRVQLENAGFVDDALAYPFRQRFQIKITEATNVRNADWSAVPFQGVSDPYTMFQIVGKPHTKQKTRMIVDDLNPKWNFQGMIEDYDDGDELEFNVMDWDTAKWHDPLGRCTLASQQFHRRPFDGNVELVGKGTDANQKAFLKVRVAEVPTQTCGEVSVILDLRKDPTKQAVEVSVHGLESDPDSSLKRALAAPKWAHLVRDTLAEKLSRGFLVIS